MHRQATSKQKLNIYTLSVVSFLGLGSLSFGYGASVIGTLLGQPSFLDYFELETADNGTALTSTMNGIFQAGGVVGALSLPWIADKYGRKWALAVPAILMIISGAVMAGSTHVAVFIVFRFFSGAASYMLVSAPPLMMSEIVPANLRGGLVEFHGVFYMCGYALATWVGFGCFFWPNNVQTWRLPVALQCLCPLLLLMGLYSCPESPRWLVMQGREDQARQILMRIHSHSESGHDWADRGLYQIKKQVEIDLTFKCNWIGLFKKPSYRKRALLGVATTGMVQFSGVLFVTNYGPVIYRLLGYSDMKQLLFPSLWLTVGCICFFLGPIVIDMIPRNWLLGTGIIGTSSMLSIIAALIANFVPSTNTAALEAIVAMFFIYQPFIVIFLDGTQFVYLGEIFPNHLRAKGVCLGAATIALMNIVWLQSAPKALETIGWKFFLCFIVPGFLSGICVIKFWPDTRHRPLEEIGALFQDSEVAVYQSQLEIDSTTHRIRDQTMQPSVEESDTVVTKAEMSHIEG